MEKAIFFDVYNIKTDAEMKEYLKKRYEQLKTYGFTHADIIFIIFEDEAFKSAFLEKEYILEYQYYIQETFNNKS